MPLWINSVWVNQLKTLNFSEKLAIHFAQLCGHWANQPSKIRSVLMGARLHARSCQMKTEVSMFLHRVDRRADRAMPAAVATLPEVVRFGQV